MIVRTTKRTLDKGAARGRADRRWLADLSVPVAHRYGSATVADQEMMQNRRVHRKCVASARGIQIAETLDAHTLGDTSGDRPLAKVADIADRDHPWRRSGNAVRKIVIRQETIDPDLPDHLGWAGDQVGPADHLGCRVAPVVRDVDPEDRANLHGDRTWMTAAEDLASRGVGLRAHVLPIVNARMKATIHRTPSALSVLKIGINVLHRLNVPFESPWMPVRIGRN